MPRQTKRPGRKPPPGFISYWVENQRTKTQVEMAAEWNVDKGSVGHWVRRIRSILGI